MTKFKLKKMEINDTYYVMGRWIDDFNSDDNFVIIESYYAKEKAFKLRDLLNELTEMDIVYFVEFNEEEIKE